MPIPFARTTLSCALIGCSLTAYAQTEPVTLNDTVVSASGFEQKITEAPASISVISQEDLQQKRYGNLAQALEDVEGIDVRQGTGKTGGLNISIRGLPSEYTLILIDGRRQNTAGNVTPNGFNETATSFMPPMSAIERIEVIRGPMSTLYGSDAMGGVVNIITKKVAPEWGGSLSVDHTYQDNRDYGDASKASLYASGPLIDGLLGLAVRGSIYDRSESDLSFDNDSTVSKRGAAPVEGRNTNFGARLSLTPHENHDFPWTSSVAARCTTMMIASSALSTERQEAMPSVAAPSTHRRPSAATRMNSASNVISSPCPIPAASASVLSTAA